MTVGGGAAAAVCWPKQAVELSVNAYKTASEPAKTLWLEYG